MYIPANGITTPVATRVTGADAIQAMDKTAPVPHHVSESADLHGSCLDYITRGRSGNGAGLATTHAGRNLYFRIREHSMCSVLHSLAYYDISTESGSTFLILPDSLCHILTGCLHDLCNSCFSPFFLLLYNIRSALFHRFRLYRSRYYRAWEGERLQ